MATKLPLAPILTIYTWEWVAFISTSRVPVGGKSSVCLICMKYRIIILIIFHYQPGSNIIIVYWKHVTHARTRARARAHTRTHTHTAEPFRLALWDGSVAPNRDGPFRWRQWESLFHSNKHTRGRSGFPRFCVLFAYKKLLGRTETRTCDRMCFQTIRTVWDISRDDHFKHITHTHCSNQYKLQTHRLRNNS